LFMTRLTALHHGALAAGSLTSSGQQMRLDVPLSPSLTR
jgi:hypothetical protein